MKTQAYELSDDQKEQVKRLGLKLIEILNKEGQDPGISPAAAVTIAVTLVCSLTDGANRAMANPDQPRPTARESVLSTLMGIWDINPMQFAIDIGEVDLTGEYRKLNPAKL